MQNAAIEAAETRRDVRWEHFPHGADVGVRGRGTSVAAAFEGAALALTAVIAEPGDVAGDERVEVVCHAPDAELLLVDWLNALVFEMATRHLLFGRFAVDISGDRLSGQAWGEAVNTDRHAPAVEIKGATPTELKVAPDDGGWLAQCVVDV